MLAIISIILILIGINALYVAAEFAAVSVNTSRVQTLADERGGLARRLLPYLKDAHALDRYIAGCQIGITISSLVLGAYGQARLAVVLEPLFARLGGLQEVAAQSTSAVTVLIGLTAIQMVLGELVPKSLALQYPTRVALWTVIPMQWSLRAMWWFIAILNGSGAFVLRLFGFESSGHRHIHSPEELEYLVAESRQGGLLEPYEQRRLTRALRLSGVRVDELLVPRVRMVAVDIDGPPGDALRLILDSPFTRLPVYRGTIDDVIGFLHAKDVARQVAERPEGLDIPPLVRPVLMVPGTTTADWLLVRMRDERRQLAIVLDEYGGTAGLVTIEDVLEQVVGEIVDEFRDPATAPERLPDGRVRLPGDMHLDALEPWLGSLCEKGDAHTVGGRVIEALGRVPLAGERVEIDGVVIEIETVVHHAVTSVLATARDRRNHDHAEGDA